VKANATRPGVLYTVVIGERVTEVLDIPAILRGADSGSTQAGLTMKSAGVAN